MRARARLFWFFGLVRLCENNSSLEGLGENDISSGERSFWHKRGGCRLMEDLNGPKA